MKTSDDTECEGCAIYKIPNNKDRCNIVSSFTNRETKHDCPCKTCIVKFMCKVRACEYYRRYCSEYFSYLKGNPS